MAGVPQMAHRHACAQLAHPGASVRPVPAPARPLSTAAGGETSRRCSEACSGARRSTRRLRNVATLASSSVPRHPGRKTVSTLQNAAAAGSSQFLKRVLAGCLMGAAGAAIIVQGGWAYLTFMEFFVFQSSQEFFAFVTAVELRDGIQPPPAWATALITLCTMSLPLYSFLTGGKIAVALALASFTILSIIVTTVKTPLLSTFSSAIFGLLYCGYLPSYWIKLRLLAAPAVAAPLAVHWPVILGGVTHVTVGFVSTFMAIACVVAADVGAYFVGKSFGRTPLTKLSPKKTVEGAVGGAVAASLCAFALRVLTGWPFSPLATMGFGLVVFLASLLGDLIESVMKRDAGVKDSGTLIPGHGGILDRFDSYIFTGAVVYFYIQCLPLFAL